MLCIFHKDELVLLPVWHRENKTKQNLSAKNDRGRAQYNSSRVQLATKSKN